MWVFNDKPHVKIGRAPDNDIVLANSLVSRHHIDLKYIFKMWKVESLGTNGTYVDGQSMTVTWVSRSGMEVQMGQSGPILRLWLEELSQESVIDSQDRLEEQTLTEQPILNYCEPGTFDALA